MNKYLYLIYWKYTRASSWQAHYNISASDSFRTLGGVAPCMPRISKCLESLKILWLDWQMFRKFKVTGYFEFNLHANSKCPVKFLEKAECIIGPLTTFDLWKCLLSKTLISPSFRKGCIFLKSNYPAKRWDGTLINNYV